MAEFPVQHFVKHEQVEVRLRCPACRHQGVLERPGGEFPDMVINSTAAPNRLAGVRRCPNDQCRELIFFVKRLDNGAVVKSHPSEVLDFDATGLPESVLASLEEAVKCHAAGCYRAAAIMVRRTLEDLCADQKIDPTVHKTLKARLDALATIVVLPTALFDGLDALRLLGNDAAHIEAQTYADVGEEEVVLGIDVAKEILKAVYQLGDLVARLHARRQSS